ncbi:MAG: hypothetical protein ACLUTA_17330 [Blautia wexlerae]
MEVTDETKEAGASSTGRYRIIQKDCFVLYAEIEAEKHNVTWFEEKI